MQSVFPQAASQSHGEHSSLADQAADPVGKPLPELLTLAQVAELFRRSKRTLRSWEKAGVLRRVPNLGRAVLYRRDEIERLIAGGRP